MELNKRNEILNQQTKELNDKTKLLSQMALEEKKSQEKLMNVVSQVAGKQISSELGVDKFLQDFAKGPNGC